MNQEVIKQISNDPIYALNFGFDNNAAGILNELKTVGYPVRDESEAYNLMKYWVTSGKGQAAYEILKKVPYNKTASAEPYTLGFESYFMTESQKSDPSGRFDLGGFLSGLGAGILGYVGYTSAMNNAGTTGPGTAPTQAEIDAAKAEAEKKAAEAKKKAVWTGIAIGGGALLLALLAWWAFKGDKKKKDS